ncbi:MAG: hypothetical protein D6675_03760 [Gemmatimonadetes bacterium]|nr:MAG: hypothetical protein D6675_03760 [Gemmatimonadota bacterium]
MMIRQYIPGLILLGLLVGGEMAFAQAPHHPAFAGTDSMTDCGQMISQFETALADPHLPDSVRFAIHLKWGNCLIRRQPPDYHAALEHFHTARQIDPFRVEVYEALAHSYFALQAFDKAILNLDKAFLYTSDNFQLRRQLQERINAVMDMPDGHNWVHNILAEPPTSKWTYWYIAVRYLQQDSLALAMKTADEAQKFFSERESPTGGMHLILGRSQYKAGNIAQALAHFDTLDSHLETLSLEDALWKEELAAGFLSAGQWAFEHRDVQQADRFLKRALTLSVNPRWRQLAAETYVKGGTIYLNPAQKRLDIAQFCFEQAINTLDSTLVRQEWVPWAYLNAGKTYLDTTHTDYALADSCFHLLLALTGNSDIWRDQVGFAYYDAGRAAFQRAEPDQAVICFEKSYQISPRWHHDIATFYAVQAQQFLEQQRLSECVATLFQGKRFGNSPSFGEPFYEVGLAYDALGNDSAYVCYLSALESDPALVEPIFQTVRERFYQFRVTTDEANDLYPTWRGDNRTLIFTSFRQNRIALWQTPFDVPQPDRVFPEETANQWAGVVSHRGDQLVFISDKHQSIDLWLADLTTVPVFPQPLTHRLDIKGVPAWSAADTLVAFTTKGNPLPHIQAVRVADGSLIRLTPIDSVESHPAWHPKGDRFAVVSYPAGKPVVTVVPLVDRTRQHITASFSAITALAWHPTLNQLWIAADGQFYMWERDSGVIQQLRLAAETVDHPAWSPDGHWLAYTATQDGNADIWVIRYLPPAVEELKMRLGAEMTR